MKHGRVLWGANNIFTIQDLEDGGTTRCRIKGKVLDRKGESEKSYNPLAPGDLVYYQGREENGDGVIVSRQTRENAFIRLNKKRMSPQCIAANIDLLIAVCSPVMPPFRPRFIDRVLAAAGDLPAMVLLNKYDQIEGYEELAPDALEMVNSRLENYSDMGYLLHRCSAHNRQGLEELKELLRGKRVLIFGQSGVGKSSLLNAMYPDLSLKIGDVSVKYNRGRHTTTLARAYPIEDGLLIDTPGIREIIPHGIAPEELSFRFRDFLPLIPHCRFQPCSHTEEPDCAVRSAVAAGELEEDRYESYLRLLDDLKRTKRENER